MSEANAPPTPRARDVVGIGAPLVALLDIVFAMTWWWLAARVPPTRILQSVAAGVLGRDAFAGGTASAALGAALHLGLCVGIAAVLLLACRIAPALLRRPLLFGSAYGLVVFAVMNGVIVPLSRAMVATWGTGWMAASVAAHVLLVGMPLAVIAARSARRG